MIKDIKEIQSKLGKDVKSLTRMLDATMAQIPEDKMENINEARGDMQKMLNSIKTGKVDVTNEILKKYVNFNR